MSSATGVGRRLIGRRGRERVRVRGITERIGRHPGVIRMMMIGMAVAVLVLLLLAGTASTAAGITAGPARKKPPR